MCGRSVDRRAESAAVRAVPVPTKAVPHSCTAAQAAVDVAARPPRAHSQRRCAHGRAGHDGEPRFPPARLAQPLSTFKRVLRVCFARATPRHLLIVLQVRRLEAYALHEGSASTGTVT